MATQKPVDRWLVLTGIAFAIAVGLPAMPTPRSPWLIVAFLGAIFFLIISPLWNYWWIEDKRWRQIPSSVALIALLVAFGRFLWPLPNKPEFHIVEQVPEVRNEGNVREIEAYVTFENDGDAATFQLTDTNVWMLGSLGVIDPAVVRQLREKVELAPISVRYEVEPHEKHGFASVGLRLNKREEEAFLTDRLFLYYAGRIDARNDGGTTTILFCGMLQHSGTILDCPDE